MKFHLKTNYFDHYFGVKVTPAEEKKDDYTVDFSKLFFGQKLAHGADGQVYRGSYKNEQVAVKIIRVPDVDDGKKKLEDRLQNKFKREATLLSRLHHKNVIKFVAAFENPPVFGIVMEYLSRGSLRFYLNKLDKKLLPLPTLISMALDIARGMEYIHSQGIIHWDLKPENILVDDREFRLKVADFGSSCEEKSVAHHNLVKDNAGTYRWMAPELIKGKSYNRKVDVYPFGLILWELFAGTIPFHDMIPEQVAFAVANKNLRPNIPDHCPQAMRGLIERCWSSQPKKRPEFWQIVKELEQFEINSVLCLDETLNIVKSTSPPTCQDRRNSRLLHWIKMPKL